MVRHRITVQRASEEELSGLASWYTMIDPEMPDLPADEVNARFVNAFRSGILGRALGHGRDSLDALLEHIDLDEQLLSRILVLSARCDGETVGMLLCSPPVGLYNDVMPQTVSYPQRTVQQMHVALVVGLVKLEMVAISPEHRGRGLGARLVRNAIDTARKSAVERMYGQFHNEDGLTGFYEKLGFTVPGPGQAISAVSDFPIQIHSAPSETPFQLLVAGCPRRGAAGQRHIPAVDNLCLHRGADRMGLAAALSDESHPGRPRAVRSRQTRGHPVLQATAGTAAVSSRRGHEDTLARLDRASHLPGRGGTDRRELHRNQSDLLFVHHVRDLLRDKHIGPVAEHHAGRRPHRIHWTGAGVAAGRGGVGPDRAVPGVR